MGAGACSSTKVCQLDNTVPTLTKRKSRPAGVVKMDREVRWKQGSASCCKVIKSEVKLYSEDTGNAGPPRFYYCDTGLRHYLDQEQMRRLMQNASSSNKSILSKNHELLPDAESLKVGLWKDLEAGKG